MFDIGIEMGTHTMKVPYGMKKLMSEMIDSLGITQGSFKVQLGENIKGINKKGIKFIKLLPEYSAIMIKAQPSSKDGRHICTVYFPDIHKVHLPKFAELLQKKVGQEDVAADEVLESSKKIPAKEAVVLPVTELSESVFIRQQQHKAEAELFTPEMQTLILSGIFDKNGTGWIEKKNLFKLLDSFKLEFPSRKLIGKLLRLGYLEDDKENTGKRSRLTTAACLLVNNMVELPITIKEEDSKILSIFESLKEAAGTYVALSADHVKASDDLEELNTRNAQLGERLKKITVAITKRLEENERKILEKSAEADLIKLQITPRMVEANRRLELMFSDLPTE